MVNYVLACELSSDPHLLYSIDTFGQLWLHSGQLRAQLRSSLYQIDTFGQLWLNNGQLRRW